MDAISCFVPPALTIDSVDVAVEDYDALMSITVHVTNWRDNNAPRFTYTIGDTIFERTGMLVNLTEKFDEYVDILTFKVFDNSTDVLYINVEGVERKLNISDYIKIDNCEDIYPNMGIWVLL